MTGIHPDTVTVCALAGLVGLLVGSLIFEAGYRLGRRRGERRGYSQAFADLRQRQQETQESLIGEAVTTLIAAKDWPSLDELRRRGLL